MHRKLAIFGLAALCACTANAGAPTPLANNAATAPPATDAALSDAAERVAAPLTTAPVATPPPPQTAAPDIVAGPTAAELKQAVGSVPDMAIVSADGRIAMLHDGRLSEPTDGLVAADGETLIATAVSDDGLTTTVTWTGLRDGIEQAAVQLDGRLTAVATDPTAGVVALTAARADPTQPGSEIVIATRDGEMFRRSYATELLPEGFSDVYSETAPIPAALFVVEYLDAPPADAEAPRRYRVRVLDLANGQLSLPRNLRTKSELVDEQMLGFGRSHVLSPSNGLLFTLYRGLDDYADGYAFVHTLGFVNGVWCLDLPERLELGDLPGSLVLVDDDRKLLVMSANGVVTEFVIDDITNQERDPLPRRTERVWTTSERTARAALASSGNVILVGQGGTLRWVAADSLTVETEITSDVQIDAVAISPAGNAIVAGPHGISEISPTGELIGQMLLPSSVGEVARIVLLGGTARR